MHRIPFRLRFAESGIVIEAYLDERLSFAQNFSMLEEISSCRFGNCVIYEPNKKIFLEENIPLKEFRFSGFPCLLIFTPGNV